MVQTTVMIPTQRRLGGLAVAVRSVLAQRNVDFNTLEIVVVDNDQVPSAQSTIEGLATGAACPLHYVHEPRAGVANARNAGMAKASGDRDERGVQTFVEEEIHRPGNASARDAWVEAVALLRTTRRTEVGVRPDASRRLGRPLRGWAATQIRASRSRRLSSLG